MSERTIDICVIGGGPAGMAAATLAAEHGAATILIDEQAELGGQIYRAAGRSPLRGRGILGKEYDRGGALRESFLASGSAYAAGACVWSIDPALTIAYSANGAASIIRARQIIVATGAMERPFPIPGWTLPGVMTAGAAQILLKTGGIVAAKDAVLAGSGPLLWLLAWQYLNAGVRHRAILDTTPRRNYLKALRHAPAFLMSPYFHKGLALQTRVRRDVEVWSGIDELRAEGDGRLERVVFRAGAGREREIATGTLLLHQGVVPNINLCAALGCDMEWDGSLRCWRPFAGQLGQTSVKGVAIAGDGGGISGAAAAEHQGRLAALGSLLRLGRMSEMEVEREATAYRRALAGTKRGRRFLDTLFEPNEKFRIPTGGTLVCRCEEVSARQVNDVLALGCPGPNQMKAMLRTGMGPCQGRLCGLTVTEMIARHTAKNPEEVGYYRIRAPLKPVSVAELASLPQSEKEWAAVNRSAAMQMGKHFQEGL